MSNNNNNNNKDNNNNKKNSEQHTTTKLQPQPHRHYSEQQLPASIIDENQIVQSYVPPGTVRLPEIIGRGATAAHNKDGTTAATARQWRMRVQSTLFPGFPIAVSKPKDHTAARDAPP